MNLLVFSFACSIPSNQSLFSKVEEKRGWDITIVTPSNWRTGFDEVREPKCSEDFDGDLVSVPVWFSGNIPLHIYKSSFISLLRREDPHAIYVHHEAYGLATFQVYFANWLLDQKPIGFYSAQNIKKNYPPPFSLFESFVYSQSDFSFPITERVLSVLREKGYSGPATVLPLGVDASEFHAEDHTPRSEMCSSPEDVLIGYVGRIEEAKGLSTFLDALNHVPAKNYELILIGNGPYEERLFEKARSLGIDEHITHLGYVDHSDISSYISALDMLVLPSETQSDWKEQFGRVIIEALACKTPVVGSDSGEIPHLIRDTGGGLIFPEGDPGSLADRLQTLIGNPERRRELADEGQRVVLRKYTDSARADQFASTIEEAV